jgi:hypothetical protein
VAAGQTYEVQYEPRKDRQEQSQGQSRHKAGWPKPEKCRESAPEDEPGRALIVRERIWVLHWEVILLHSPQNCTRAGTTVLSFRSKPGPPRHINALNTPVCRPVGIANPAHSLYVDGCPLGAVALCVGIRCGAISSDMNVSLQAARSIG